MRGHASGPFTSPLGTFGPIRVQQWMLLDVVAAPAASMYVNASPTDPVKLTFLPWVTTALAHGTNQLSVGNAGSPTAYVNVTSLGSTGLGTSVSYVLTANTNVTASLTSAAIAASLLLTFTGIGVAGDTVTIGATTYTYAASAGAANTVVVGGATANSVANLISAINASAGAGTTYGTGTVANASASAAAGAGTTILVTAKTAGTAGNSIAVASSLTHGSWAGGGLFLLGGDSASTAGAVTVFMDT